MAADPVDPMTRMQAVMDDICTRLADGESLIKICKRKGMPSKALVLKWVSGNVALRDQYARAREAQADHFAEEIITIADTAEDAQKGRLQVDARKWVASKMAPKKYGDKVTTEHVGADGGPIEVKDVTPAEAYRLMKNG